MNILVHVLCNILVGIWKKVYFLKCQQNQILKTNQQLSKNQQKTDKKTIFQKLYKLSAIFTKTFSDIWNFIMIIELSDLISFNKVRFYLII